MNNIGSHYVIDLAGCDSSIIKQSNTVQSILVEAAVASKANIVDIVFHNFKPYGVSGVIIISESHFTIHTWPEYGYAAVDIFTCSRSIDINAAIHLLTKKFKATNVKVTSINRGMEHGSFSCLHDPTNKEMPSI